MGSDLAEYPFEPLYFSVDGHALAYLDEGEGLPVVMVHGNPSWSYLYRNLVSAFRDRYRCIVPDHLGCGSSDKPTNYPYRLHNHVDNLERLLDALAIDRCILIVHDWGGAIGMGWAGRHPERVAGVVVLNTAAFRSQRIPLRIAICRWPFLGPLLVRGLNGFARAATFMAVARPMRSEIAQGFLAPYDNWHNRIAVHRFVQDIPMDPHHPSWNTLVAVEQSLVRLRSCPMLICWGGQDFCFNDSFYNEWQHRFPEADAHYFPEASHYVLEDGFADILPLVNEFLDNNSG
jgi:pimeloyl-ACP methyl ester carboxylesterase